QRQRLVVLGGLALGEAGGQVADPGRDAGQLQVPGQGGAIDGGGSSELGGGVVGHDRGGGVRQPVGGVLGRDHAARVLVVADVLDAIDAHRLVGGGQPDGV